MTVNGRLSKSELKTQFQTGIASRESRLLGLADLTTSDSAIIYAYGINGRALAAQLRSSGIEPIIFDSSERVRRQAENDGYLTTSAIDVDAPLIVAVGQHQIEVMASLKRPAAYFHEALHVLDLNFVFSSARSYSDLLSRRLDDVDAVYQALDPGGAERFLEVLLYRASLDPAKLLNRFSFADMWRPPVEGLRVESFCDIGAYDGDTLISTKALFPSLKRAFTIEPSEALQSAISAVADRLGVETSRFCGAAWRRNARLTADETFNGMFLVREDDTGEIHAAPLDELLSGEAFDFIKMDVEGAERDVIAGGEASLRRARCVAVAAYHFADDLVDLPLKLLDLLPASDGWRLTFSHSSQVFADSIFYAYRL